MRKLSFVDTGCTHSRVYALEQSSLQDTVPACVRMQKQGMLTNLASTTVSYDVTSFQGSKITQAAPSIVGLHVYTTPEAFPASCATNTGTYPMKKGQQYRAVMQNHETSTSEKHLP